MSLLFSPVLVANEMELHLEVSEQEIYDNIVICETITKNFLGDKDVLVDVPQCFHLEIHLVYVPCNLCGHWVVKGMQCKNKYCLTNQPYQ